MLFSIFLVVAGLATLFMGGEALVRGAVILARGLGMPRLVVGLLVVGFGTSMPELLVSIEAVFDGAAGIALGNVVGSNIANVLLILGAAALLMPISGWDGDAKRGALVAVGAGVLLFVFCMKDRLDATQGWILLALLAAYLVASYHLLARRPDSSEPAHRARAGAGAGAKDAVDSWLSRNFALAGAAVILGIALLMLGAELLIAGTVAIARAFGISDAVIGLSLVAFGTSLPELVTVVVSSIKREAEVVVGSVIGSNIFNILAILGVTLALHPIGVADRIPRIDAPLVVATSLGLLLLLAFTRRIGRSIGLAMVAMYCGYIALLYFQGVA